MRDYDRPPGPIAYAAFEAALYEAGPDGLTPTLLAAVHVPGLPPVSMNFRLTVIQQLRDRGRCVVTHVPYAVPGRSALTRPVYRHAVHVPGRAQEIRD